MKIVIAVLVGIGFLLFLPGHAKSLQVPVAEEPPLRPAETGEWVAIPATVTAYTSSVDETDGDPSITASGSVAGPGTIACPAMYEFGQKVRIEGKEYVCEDRMAKRYRYVSRFDMWIETKYEAYQWGVRHITIEVWREHSEM